MERAVGVALLLVVDGDGEGDRRGAEGNHACLGSQIDGELRHDGEGLIDASDPVNAVDRLHHLTYADGNAHVMKLRPAGERIGREGQREPALIGDVVVRLLGVGAREIGAGEGGVAWDINAEDGVARIAADGVEPRRAYAGDLPLAAIGLVEPGVR